MSLYYFCGEARFFEHAHLSEPDESFKICRAGEFGRCAEKTSRPQQNLSNFARKAGKWVIIPVIIYITFLSFRTISRNFDWHDRITFYEQTLRFSPDSARVRNNLAMAYADNKQYEKAEREYLRAIQISDTYPQPHHNLGNIYVQLEKLDRAIAEYRKAIKLDRYFGPAYLNLASVYLKKGEKKETVRILEQYLKLYPDDSRVRALIPL